MILIITLLFIILTIGHYSKKKLKFQDKLGIINLLYLYPIFICYLLYIKNFPTPIIIFITILAIILINIIYFDKKFTILRLIMFCCMGLSFIIVVCIVISLFYESTLFFNKIPILDFLFTTKWNPNAYSIHDKSSYGFGILPLLTGTFIIVIISILTSVPLALLSAIYISEYANKKARYIFNTALEILSGIPTVVYGYFAVVFLSPVIRSIAKFYHIRAQSENALVAGLTIGIMMLPFITSLMENSIRSVPKILRYGSMALGATSAETIFNIILPFALPSIVSAILLSISRVIGETMIVLMAAGINANLTLNPLHSVTTITVQIATLLTGDNSFNSIQTSSAYALGLTLFIITWLLNSCALYIIRESNKL